MGCSFTGFNFIGYFPLETYRHNFRKVCSYYPRDISKYQKRIRKQTDYQEVQGKILIFAQMILLCIRCIITRINTQQDIVQTVEITFISNVPRTPFPLKKKLIAPYRRKLISHYWFLCQNVLKIIHFHKILSDSDIFYITSTLYRMDSFILGYQTFMPFLRVGYSIYLFFTNQNSQNTKVCFYWVKAIAECSI